MSSETFARHTLVDAPAETVYGWHLRPGALERLTPPWIRLRVRERTGGIADGARVALDLAVGPLHVPWVVEHRDVQAGQQFRDVQVSGPFARWEHTHRFEADGDAASYMEDRVEYALPGGGAGEFVANGHVRRELERLFVYRHRVLKHDIALHRQYASVAPMKIGLTGAGGLIGSALLPFLATAGHRVIRLVRAPAPASGSDVSWDAATGRVDAEKMEGTDAVIHLAGEGLAALRWTGEKKRRIRESRIQTTRLLCETLAGMAKPPKVLLSASAVGFYGNRGGEILHEESDPGTGFLPQLCREWEEATRPASEKGIRVVHLRFGVVLSPAGGALRAMLIPFRVGLGGPIGSGWQYMSWIAVDDVVSAIYHGLLTPKLSGPVNLTGPYVVTNRDFGKALGTVLDRPSFVPVPAVAARLALGEMADEVLIASARVEPRRLLDTGFVFRYPDIEGALRHVLGRA